MLLCSTFHTCLIRAHRCTLCRCGFNTCRIWVAGKSAVHIQKEVEVMDNALDSVLDRVIRPHAGILNNAV